MSSQKKTIRRTFRISVFERDCYQCVMCGLHGQDRQADHDEGLPTLDAHHIENRNKFQNGGYNILNGISLCDDCHIKAEAYHTTGVAVENFAPEDLYTLIGSSFEKAIELDSNMSSD